MNIITDNQSADTASAIERAWQDPASFLLLPGRYESRRGEFGKQLELLPAPYRTGHFVLTTSGSTGEPRLVIGEKTRSERLAALLHQVQQNQPVLRRSLSVYLVELQEQVLLDQRCGILTVLGEVQSGVLEEIGGGNES